MCTNNLACVNRNKSHEPQVVFLFLSFCRFIPSGNGDGLRQARVQTLEPNQWMKEVFTFFLSSNKFFHVKYLLVLQHLHVGFKVETRGHGTRKQVTQTKFEM